MQNTAKFARNLIKYVSINIFETYLGYWGCLIAVNQQIYLETSSPQQVDNVPKLPGGNCCKKLGTSHDVKSSATGSFLERFVVKIANDVKKH